MEQGELTLGVTIICTGRGDVRVSTVYWSIARMLTLCSILGDVDRLGSVVNGPRRAHLRRAKRLEVDNICDVRMARSSFERLDGGGRKARGDGTVKEMVDAFYIRPIA